MSQSKLLLVQLILSGTNPSLLEALASTKLNLLFDVGFNKECGCDSCFYFDESLSALKNLIDKCDKLNIDDLISFGNLAKSTIQERYSWLKIVKDYENVFSSM